FCHIYMSDFPIIENEGILLVDSRLVAERLGIEHESFMETIYAYQSQIEKEFGIFRFQTGKIDGRGRPAKYALLTEDQSQVLMTFSRNTPQVIQCKIDLVKAFSKAKDLLKRRQQVTDAGSRIPYWYQRMRLATSDNDLPLQSGYFCIYLEMMSLFSQLEGKLNYIVPDVSPVTGKHLIPDISIGKRLNKFLRAEDEMSVFARKEIFGSGLPIDFRVGCSHFHEIALYNHVYPVSSHGQNNIQQANSYPIKYQSLFRYFLEEYWVPDNCIKYLQERDPDGVEYIRFAYNQLNEKVQNSLQGTLLGKLIRSLPSSSN
ncbi:Rha family transcriptional regulator, partial [Floridanema evergladense]